MSTSPSGIRRGCRQMTRDEQITAALWTPDADYLERLYRRPSVAEWKETVMASALLVMLIVLSLGLVLTAVFLRGAGR